MKKQPNYAAELTLPWLLNNGQATRFYDLSATEMQTLRKETFYLQLPGSNFRYPNHYAREQRRYLWADNAHGKLAPSREFAQSSLAHDIMQEEGDYLERQLRSDANEGLLKASDVASILFIGRASLADWGQRNEIEVVRHRGQVYVPAGALREVCTWHYPEVLETEPASFMGAK